MVINKVRKYRLKLKMSQAQLAELCGVGQSTISEIESGTHVPSLEVALRLSRALHVPTDRLFSLGG